MVARRGVAWRVIVEAADRCQSNWRQNVTRRFYFSLSRVKIISAAGLAERTLLSPVSEELIGCGGLDVSLLPSLLLSLLHPSAVLFFPLDSLSFSFPLYFIFIISFLSFFSPTFLLWQPFLFLYFLSRLSFLPFLLSFHTLPRVPYPSFILLFSPPFRFLPHSILIHSFRFLRPSLLKCFLQTLFLFLPFLVLKPSFHSLYIFSLSLHRLHFFLSFISVPIFTPISIFFF